MASVNSHELQNISGRQSATGSGADDAELNSMHEDSPAEIEMRSLPPTDYGKQAYLVLAGCTLIQAPVWGGHSLLINPLISLTKSRLLSRFWRFPRILYHPQQLQKLTRSHCYSRNNPQRPHVPNDAALFHTPNPLPPPSPILRTHRPRHHSWQPAPLFIRNTNLATDRQPRRPLRNWIRTPFLPYNTLS
jgi:hypothetical protein